MLKAKLLLIVVLILAGCRPIAAPTATPVPTPMFARLLKVYEAWQAQALSRIDAYDADPTIFADSTWRLQTANVMQNAEESVRALAERAGRNREVYFALADSYQWAKESAAAGEVFSFATAGYNIRLQMDWVE